MEIHLDYFTHNNRIIGPKRHSISGWVTSDSLLNQITLTIDTGPDIYGTIGVERNDLNFGSTGIEFVNVFQGLHNGTYEIVVRAKNADHDVATLTRTVVFDSSQTEQAPPPPDRNSQYAMWLRSKRYPVPANKLSSWKKKKPAIARDIRPKFSIIMPTFNSNIPFLSEAIGSIVAQTFHSWELIIIDDGSTETSVRLCLQSFAYQDPRISIHFLSENSGIAVATQAGIAKSAGEFIGFVDHDDLLWPEALEAIARVIDRDHNVDIIYTDEDKIDANGQHFDPFFKPDWSPHLYLTVNYTCHFTVYRSATLETIGPISPDFSGSQDYDLMLRATEVAKGIAHIPDILYSWRANPGSTAHRNNAKPYAHTAALSALGAALKRRGIPGRFEQGLLTGTWRLRRDSQSQPLVDIIVPTITVQHIDRSVRTLLTHTTYSNYRITILINSDSVALHEACTVLAALDSRIQFITHIIQPFNYSALNNFGVHMTHGPFICFLNDDTEVIDGEWLNALMEIAVAPSVGVVGAQLLYPDQTVQHAGVVLGIGGVAGHAFKHFSREHPGANGLRLMIRDVSAVTFACAVVRRAAFDDVGGLDEINVPVSYSDVDFCLRVRALNYDVVYTPYALLTHHESASRGLKGHLFGNDYMNQQWGEVLSNDPFYNRNLSRDHEDFRIALTSSIIQPFKQQNEVQRLAVRTREVLAADGIAGFLQKVFKFIRRRYNNYKMTARR